ncbi:MAG: hypothetical protein HZA31_05725 [Opitutae bacterium]|nr:hypothetical protein [Opitutae bacterium]
MTTPTTLPGALGVEFFTTDLHMPQYRAGTAGTWCLRHSGFTLDRGYYSGLWAVQGMPALLRRRDPSAPWETWMSLSAHEIESQEFGCRYAAGATVVMGLGMGWIAANLALRPAVTRVTVVERDPQVIELFHHSGATDGLPAAAREKIEIVSADALEWRPASPVDYLYADIWLNLAEPQTLDDVRRMQANVQARSLYFWGQELVIAALARRLAPEAKTLTPELLQRCLDEEIRLPLLIPTGLDYAALIDHIVANRRARGLPLG